MKNKYELRKCLKKFLIITIVLSVIFIIMETIEYKKYKTITNYKVSSIIDEIKKEYPNVEDEKILNIINNTSIKTNNFLSKYSIDIANDTVVKENEKINFLYTIIKTFYFIISLAGVMLIFLKYNSKKDKNIESITKCIEEINKRNYKLDIDDISEDELSILKNEIYKTTIMLKEQAENSKKDKIQLKDSLSDISHQLKTPLTSIMIMLDNIIDHPDMKKETRDDFIKEIKIEMTNINFLVQSILKLSKLDSNTVEYFYKNVNMSELINKSINRLLPLCDLKNIEVNIDIKNDNKIKCDEVWQIEAISNVIKNCIEHSKEGSNIEINGESNNVYNLIEIIDHGTGITKQELPHIFERFYKGKDSNSNSIGIGLALAKTIINQNNGTINVESEEGKGTKFEIKYYK